MPLTKTVPADTDITVTTATGGEADVRAQLGGDDAPAEGKTPAAEAAKPTAAAADDDDDADAARPDAEVSDAARTMRRNRTSERLTRLNEDNALYEDSIRRMGGKVIAFEKKTYANPQAEIDALSKRRNALLQDVNKLLKNPPRRQAEPPSRRVAEPAAAAGAPAAPVAPTFEFPTFDAWQEKNPDGDFIAYGDARTDARYKFNQTLDAFHRRQANDKQRQVASERAEADAIRQLTDGIDAFKAEHADYDAVTSAITLGDYVAADDEHGEERIRAFQRSIFREGAKGAPILYYLAQHPDELRGLLNAPTPGDFVESFGVLKHVVRSASATPASAAAAASAAEPARPAAAAKPAASPKTSAPAPLETVRGSATTTRTLQSIADDDDDADSYIEARRRRP